MPRVPPAVLALVLALACAPAAGAATVTIAPSGGGPARALDLGTLAARFDVHDAAYTVRAADGSTSRVTVADGISLGALLAVAGLDGDPFTYVEIPRPDGSTSSYVLADHVGDTGAGPPVVWADGQAVHFLRPSGGADDPNADDELAFAGGTLALELHTGELLVPRIRVSTTVPRPHQAVRFSASLAAGALAPGMAFQWYFDGGAYVVGASVTHRFASPGPYKVQLNVVRGTTNVTHLPTIVHIRVVAELRRHQASRRRAGGGAGAGGGSGSGASGHGGGTAVGGVVTTGAQQPPAARGLARRPAPAARRPPSPARRPQGTLVSGTLLAAASAAAAPAPGAPGAPAAPTAGAAAHGPLHVPVGAWVAIGLAALLALGWALESRHTLPFWQP